MASMDTERGVNRVFVDRLKEKLPVGMPRRKWKNYTKCDLEEEGLTESHCWDLAEDNVMWRTFVLDGNEISEYFTAS